MTARRLAVTASLLLCLGAAPAAGAAAEALPARVEGTTLVVLRPGGRRIGGQALIGAVVVGGDAEAGGLPAAFRIDGIRADPDDPEITLHDLSVRDPATGGWRPYCVPDDRGVAGAVFVAGSWDARGTHLRDGRFSLSCTSGGIGKCVRAGYKPWQTAADGRPMWDYHQACTRLIRADYCGDGRARTRNGVRIEIVDRLDPAEEPGTDLAPEAAWTPEGASCVARPRLGSSLGLAVAACPDKLRGRLGAACDPWAELGGPAALLINKSPPEGR
jgi:ADYC domain